MFKFINFFLLYIPNSYAFIPNGGGIFVFSIPCYLESVGGGVNYVHDVDEEFIERFFGIIKVDTKSVCSSFIQGIALNPFLTVLSTLFVTLEICSNINKIWIGLGLGLDIFSLFNVKILYCFISNNIRLEISKKVKCFEFFFAVHFFNKSKENHHKSENLSFSKKVYPLIRSNNNDAQDFNKDESNSNKNPSYHSTASIHNFNTPNQKIDVEKMHGSNETGKNNIYLENAHCHVSGIRSQIKDDTEDNGNSKNDNSLNFNNDIKNDMIVLCNLFFNLSSEKISELKEAPIFYDNDEYFEKFINFLEKLNQNKEKYLSQELENISKKLKENCESEKLSIDFVNIDYYINEILTKENLTASDHKIVNNLKTELYNLSDENVGRIVSIFSDYITNLENNDTEERKKNTNSIYDEY